MFTLLNKINIRKYLCMFLMVLGRVNELWIFSALLLLYSCWTILSSQYAYLKSIYKIILFLPIRLPLTTQGHLFRERTAMRDIFNTVHPLPWVLPQHDRTKHQYWHRLICYHGEVKWRFGDRLAYLLVLMYISFLASWLRVIFALSLRVSIKVICYLLMRFNLVILIGPII